MGDDQGRMPAGLAPFEVYVRGNELAVREALEKVLEGLKPLDLGIEEAGTIELVLAEALNNIVEHAYPPSAGGGPIKIQCTHLSDGLHLKIQDRGVAMPGGKIPLGQIAAIGEDRMDLPEGGFGWFLIQDLARDVTYRRIGNGNELRMRLAIGMQSNT